MKRYLAIKLCAVCGTFPMGVLTAWLFLPIPASFRVPRLWPMLHPPRLPWLLWILYLCKCHQRGQSSGMWRRAVNQGNRVDDFPSHTWYCTPSTTGCRWNIFHSLINFLPSWQLIPFSASLREQDRKYKLTFLMRLHLPHPPWLHIDWFCSENVGYSNVFRVKSLKGTEIGLERKIF